MTILVSSAIALADAFGYMTHAEVVFLAELSAGVPSDGIIVNIGAGAGTSSLAIAAGNSSARRFSVDQSAGSPLGGLENERNAFAEAGCQSLTPQQLHSESTRVAKDWEHGMIDLLFIDGDHSPDGVRSDILAWLPLVKPGGIIALHDYGSNNWPGVKEAVDELLTPSFHSLGIQDTLIAFRCR